MLDIFHTIFKFRDKESPDKLGLYPENVHVNAMPERRYLWTSRVLVILVCLSIAFNMMLASTIYVLLPQRNAAPQLFKVNQNFSQLEQVQPMEINMPVGDLITELHINEYIMQRYQITADYDELMRRWGKGSAIYWYSASEVFADFEDSDVPFPWPSAALGRQWKKVPHVHAGMSSGHIAPAPFQCPQTGPHLRGCNIRFPAGNILC